jgi:arginine decarboxylase
LFMSKYFGWDKKQVPLLASYYSDTKKVQKSFAIPGHKGRTDLIGDVLSGDRPVLLNEDPDAPSLATIKQAEVLAAKAWGAAHARFSVNGSSAANQAAVMSVASPGDKVIVSRTLHKSLFFGLIYSGCNPIWVYPEYDEETGYPIGVAPKTLEETLAAHPEVKAVFVGEPSYVGTFGDIEGQAEVCHSFNVPLVVDGAWAGHFGFHPLLPKNAIQLGADILVLSTHKTLPAYTQTAVLLVRDEGPSSLIDISRLNKVFDGTQTTSPSAVLLSSIDGARFFVQSEEGRFCIESILAAVHKGRQKIKKSIEGVIVFDGENVDPLKLIVELSQTNIDGKELADFLWKTSGIELETAESNILIPQITLADRVEDIEVLVDTLIAGAHQLLRENKIKIKPENGLSSIWQVQPQVDLSPRDAFYAPFEMVSWDESLGRVSAEIVSPYPPGIPVLAPGERITSQVLEVLSYAKESGIYIAYASDGTLSELSVVKE